MHSRFFTILSQAIFYINFKFIVRKGKKNYTRLGLLLMVPLIPMSSSVLTYSSFLQDGVGGVNGLNTPYGVVVSPDNRHVYTASAGDDAVTLFERDAATGGLTFIETYLDDGQTGGTINGLNGSQRLAISPDGAHIYVPTSSDDALVVFSRNSADGKLTYVETHVDGVGGVTGLNGSYSVAVSPDGNQVYVASSVDDAIVVFARNTVTGELTLIEELFDGVGGIDGLNSAHDVKVTLDGNHVYVAGSIDDEIAIFSRNPTTGALTFLGVERDGTIGVDGLNNVYGLFVSPDNVHVYAASATDDAVAVFSRDASTGLLTFVQVLKDGSQGGTIANLNAARAVTGTSDGAYILVVSSSDDGLVVFSRNSLTGELTLQEEYQNGIDGIAGLDGARVVAVSPDDASVYVVSSSSNAVTTFDFTSVALPVALTNFSVHLQQNTAQVNWKTTSEKHNNYFTVERSTNAEDWEPVVIVEGKGTSSTLSHYQEIDKTPHLGTSYYRLKQTDFDGSFTYSKTVSIHRSINNTIIQAYPNPTAGVLYLLTENLKPAEVKIFNLQGVEVTKLISVTKNNEQQLKFNLQALKPGSYIIKTLNGSKWIRKE